MILVSLSRPLSTIEISKLWTYLDCFIMLFVGKTGHFVIHQRNNYVPIEEEATAQLTKPIIMRFPAAATKRQALDGKYSIKVNNNRTKYRLIRLIKIHSGGACKIKTRAFTVSLFIIVAAAVKWFGFVADKTLQIGLKIGCRKCVSTLRSANISHIDVAQNNNNMNEQLCRVRKWNAFYLFFFWENISKTRDLVANRPYTQSE